MARIGVFVCLALLALTVTGGALWLSSLRLPEGAAAPGVSIAGIRIEAGVGAPAGAENGNTPGAVAPPGGAALEALVAELARRVEAVPVRLVVAPEDAE